MKEISAELYLKQEISRPVWSVCEYGRTKNWHM